MPINTRTLKSASYRRSGIFAGSITEARSKGIKTAFLCHSHKDEILAKGLQQILREDGWDVYIDWQDNELPESPDRVTAKKIQEKIKASDWFLFLATQNSRSSRWCPWEIGYADSIKGYDGIMIIPTEGDDGWGGNEYLQLYKRIDHAHDRFAPSKEGYAVFGSGNSTKGYWIKDI